MIVLRHALCIKSARTRIYRIQTKKKIKNFLGSGLSYTDLIVPRAAKIMATRMLTVRINCVIAVFFFGSGLYCLSIFVCYFLFVFSIFVMNNKAV